MAFNKKKISLYLVSGIVAAVLVIAAIFAAGIPLPSNNGTQNPTTLGTLMVSIKDAPVQLSELFVTIDSIEVQNQNSGWTKLSFNDGVPSMTFDLLTLQAISKALSNTDLPTGDYAKIRLHIKEATATFADLDGTTPLKVPSGKIDIIVKFQITEDSTTEVLIDMTADWAAISNSNNLRPILKATVTYQETALTYSPTPTPTPTTPTKT